MSQAPDPLDNLLNRWKSEEPPMPEALRQEVWRRIADAEVGPTGNGFWASIEAAFSRPSFDLAFVAACTLCGLFLAEVRVSRLQAQRNIQLAHAYIQLIDPLLEKSIAAADTPHNRLTP